MYIMYGIQPYVISIIYLVQRRSFPDSPYMPARYHFRQTHKQRTGLARVSPAGAAEERWPSICTASAMPHNRTVHQLITQLGHTLAAYTDSERCTATLPSWIE